MTNCEKIADFLYSQINLGGEIYMCNICYYHNTDLCENGANYSNCIKGIAIRLESEVTENE